MISDVDPTGDTCSTTSTTDNAVLSSNDKNIGDLLNAKNITWGGFMGGFNLSTTNRNGTTGCKRSTYVAGARSRRTADYVAAPQLVPVLRIDG